MKVSKNILIGKDEIAEYKAIVHYEGKEWPKSFLLTLWRYFSVSELEKYEHLLVEQTVVIKKKIILDQTYEVTLEKVEVQQKTSIAFWTYLLTIKKEGIFYGECQTKIYVRTAGNL
ncbi:MULTISPECIES: hypothetical protein [Enterococcus]|uniref:Protein VraC n=1 Tax=Enterococcus thailandicus TaxID=417368 RepID=A0A179ETU3_ENTTH|nr:MULTISPECIES: hypothetical protein [Enterococcus]ASZ07448.1 hypothetical protein CK496_05840 [Enterococcus thailandicus]MDA3965124.1 hypothetical protein [Enterococcus thailandicus]MDA3972737.1 hypothetical protein [Enterococcus thailandicus]MDA3975233.1 hypothetical protein [Enterococcus thailandicus]MDA3980197.1 hypothetical protein [Enterococcus thailandicus]